LFGQGFIYSVALILFIEQALSAVQHPNWSSG
jgi:hypothetical protein